MKKDFQTSGWFTIFAILLLQAPVYAQNIIKDGTLPTSVRTTDNLNFTIDSINNTNRAGNNLFHSFKEFSIPTGGSAIFNHPTDVVNIINRVTGGKISNIDGLIKANGNANIFLINPTGIIFGENARLDIGGSFFGSTAESIKFTDNIEFSAKNTTTQPLLSINLPLGLQMGSDSGAIEVKGSGYTRIPSNINPFIRNLTSSNSLQVKPGNTFALTGSEISFNGGIVTINSGNIELGSIKEGLVDINHNSQSWNFDYSNVQKFGDIKLENQSLLDASGLGSGSIILQGQNILVKDASIAFVQNRGVTSAGEIKATATDSIELRQSKGDNLLSGFLTQSLGTGNTANITIITPKLLISSGAAVISQTFSLGRGGNITINASELLEISEFPSNNSSQILTEDSSPALIQATTFGLGNGGNISVSVPELNIFDGGRISSSSLGNGSGGSINIDAKSIKLTSVNFDTFLPSVLSASTLGLGNAGSLTIDTESLVIQDGGRVSSSTLASGSAGRVTINASDFVEVRGTVPGSINPSLIISSANIVDESLQQFLGLSAIPSGDSGNITINTPVLRVLDGGEVTVRNDGTGEGGILNINADSVLLNSKGKITALTQSGTGGDINLRIKESLILRNQSLIDSESFGTGNGGNININSSVIAGVENSDIIANAVEGNGGNININTKGLFSLQFREELTTESDITASSQFGVNGTVAINNPAIDPSSSLVELPSDVVDSTQNIASGCSVNPENSFTAVGKGGLAASPEDVIISNILWNDIRDLKTFNSQEKTNIQVHNNSQNQIVEATGWVRDKQGNIEFVARSSNSKIWKQASNCQDKVFL